MFGVGDRVIASRQIFVAGESPNLKALSAGEVGFIYAELGDAGEVLVADVPNKEGRPLTYLIRFDRTNSSIACTPDQVTSWGFRADGSRLLVFGSNTVLVSDDGTGHFCITSTLPNSDASASVSEIALGSSAEDGTPGQPLAFKTIEDAQTEAELIAVGEVHVAAAIYSAAGDRATKATEEATSAAATIASETLKQKVLEAQIKTAQLQLQLDALQAQAVVPESGSSVTKSP